MSAQVCEHSRNTYSRYMVGYCEISIGLQKTSEGPTHLFGSAAIWPGNWENELEIMKNLGRWLWAWNIWNLRTFISVGKDDKKSARLWGALETLGSVGRTSKSVWAKGAKGAKGAKSQSEENSRDCAICCSHMLKLFLSQGMLRCSFSLHSIRHHKAYLFHEPCRWKSMKISVYKRKQFHPAKVVPCCATVPSNHCGLQWQWHSKWPLRAMGIYGVRRVGSRANMLALRMLSKPRYLQRSHAISAISNQEITLSASASIGQHRSWMRVREVCEHSVCALQPVI